MCDTQLQLTEHLRLQHQLFYCDACLYDNVTAFATLYAIEDLQKHRQQLKHVKCWLCPTFYNNEELMSAHMKSAHKCCKTCLVNGVRCPFWLNDVQLQKHMHEHERCGLCEVESHFYSKRQLNIHQFEMHGVAKNNEVLFYEPDPGLFSADTRKKK